MKDLTKEEYKQLSEGYQALSDIYLMHYEDMLKPSQDILGLMGLIVQMQSDLYEFKIKNKDHKKIQERQSRIDFLMAIADRFSVIHDRNRQFQFSLKKMAADVSKLTKENDLLKQQLESINKAWNQGQS